MKMITSILFLSLTAAGGMNTAFAAEPAGAPATTAKPQMANCCKKMMNMQHGEKMDHGKMEQGAMSVQPGMDGEGFAALDENRNGELSPAELAGHPMAAHFGMLDTDKNGHLSPAEFALAKDM